jgi:hypothetical protein
MRKLTYIIHTSILTVTSINLGLCLVVMPPGASSSDGTKEQATDKYINETHCVTNVCPERWR